jgi:dienelactone hydrolase
VATSSGANPAPLTAAITWPEGPGPFPVMVIIHGCTGLRPVHNSWVAEMRAAGFMTVLPDQFAPLGVTETCTASSPRQWEQLRHVHSIIRAIQRRPDVRPDRVFVMGFSMGAILTTGVSSTQWETMDPITETSPLPPVRAGIAVYGTCSWFPAATVAPLLLILPSLDDLTPARDCIDWAKGVRRGPQPRVLVLEGAHHGFDDPEAIGPRFYPWYANVHRPTGFGGTTGYSREATEQARAAIRVFLAEYR